MKETINLINIRDFLHRGGLKPHYLLIPTFLTLTAAFFEGISISVLIPLAKGIIKMDFSFVQQLPILKIIVTGFSKIFLISNTTIFILLVGIVFIAIMLKNLLQYVGALITSYQVRKFGNGLRQLIFNNYLKFGKMFFDRNNTGYLQSVLLNFSSYFTGQLQGFESVLSALFLLIVYLIIMFIISWRLTIFILIIFPTLSYLLGWLIKKIKKTSAYYTTAYSVLSNKISNILSCMPLVKLYTQEDDEKKHFASMSDQIERIEFSMDKKQNLVAPLQEAIMLIAILFLISAMAFMVVREKASEIANFLVYLFLLRRASSYFGSLNNFRSSLAIASGPISAILKMLDDRDKFLIIEGEEEFCDLKKIIEFNHLNFSYIKELPILKDVSFSIEKGKMAAIVGPTGAGKTTLINLLLRFYDCPPRSILIDGVDIRDFTLKSLRAHMAFVSQETLLFNDTLRINMTYGLDRKISNEELIDVVKKARLYDFIMSLPEKFDTYIGDRGVKLSGGEKQRVSIARALMKNAEILILDEATSSLDTRTEKLIQEAINAAVKNRTTIIIAHRLSTIKNADKIIVIEDGRLVEEGSLTELLDKKGKFYTYWQEQKFY